MLNVDKFVAAMKKEGHERLEFLCRVVDEVVRQTPKGSVVHVQLDLEHVSDQLGGFVLADLMEELEKPKYGWSNVQKRYESRCVYLDLTP